MRSLSADDRFSACCRGGQRLMSAAFVRQLHRAELAIIQRQIFHAGAFGVDAAPAPKGKQTFTKTARETPRKKCRWTGLNTSRILLTTCWPRPKDTTDITKVHKPEVVVIRSRTILGSSAVLTHGPTRTLPRDPKCTGGWGANQPMEISMPRCLRCC